MFLRRRQSRWSRRKRPDVWGYAELFKMPKRKLTPPGKSKNEFCRLSGFPRHLIFLQGFRTAKPELQLLMERSEIDRFWYDAVASALKDVLLLGNHGLRGHCDDGDLAKHWLLTHPRGQQQAIVCAELNVEQHSARTLSPNSGKCFI